MPKLTLSCLLIAPVFLASASLSAAPSSCLSISGNLVQDCGFESGTLNRWAPSPAGYDGILYGVDSTDASSGRYGAYLGGFGTPATLLQTLPTTPGRDYLLSFSLAHTDATFAPYENSIAVMFGNSVVFGTTDQQFGYQQFSFTVNAGSVFSVLRFDATDPLSFFSIDDVSVVPAAVPEPAALGATTGGLLLLSALHLGRKKRSTSLRSEVTCDI